MLSVHEIKYPIQTGLSYKKCVLLALIIECPEVGWTSGLIDTAAQVYYQGPSLLLILHSLLCGVNCILMVIGCPQ